MSRLYDRIADTALTGRSRSVAVGVTITTTLAPLGSVGFRLSGEAQEV